MQEVKIKCSDCDSFIDLSVNSNIIKHKVKHVCEGDIIYLTYFDCPICGKRFYVQIDNDSTIMKYKQCYSLMVKLFASKKQHKQINHNKSGKFKDLRAKLSAERFELAKKYDGKFVCDEYNNVSKFTLTLTN